MFWRVAQSIADVDADYGASEAAVDEVARQFYDLMINGKFEPNSPTLMNAGRPLGQLSACFVLPGRRRALQRAERHLRHAQGRWRSSTSPAAVPASAFSRLRPEGDTVRSTMGVASGPVSFMKLYDAITDVVKQGGTRRGANMGILRVDHPDIRSFITCKNDTTQITNFNISVAITDAFMEAVKANGTLRSGAPQDREGRGPGERPGDLRHDRPRRVADRASPAPSSSTGPTSTTRCRHSGATRPPTPAASSRCSPTTSATWGASTSGCSSRMERGPGDDPEEGVDWDGLRQVIHLSTHFLDNVIDANNYPLPEIHDLAQNIRRIGLGVMGWADMLVRLGIPYDSEEGVEMGRKVMEFLNEEARKASEKLAETRGVFPAWEQSIWGPDETAAKRADGERIRPERALRNCNLTTVAPTGTISIFAGCSGGIEPLFAVAFMRNQAGALMPDVNPDFVRMAKEQGWYSDELMERIATEGHIHFDEVPEEVQRVFRTAHDITPEWHVRMQAAFQEHYGLGHLQDHELPP